MHSSKCHPRASLIILLLILLSTLLTACGYQRHEYRRAAMASGFARPIELTATGPGVIAEDSVTTRATVVDIDRAGRNVTLRDSTGMEFEVYGGEELDGLANLRAGDFVEVDYNQRLASALVRSGDAPLRPRSVLLSRQDTAGRMPTTFSGTTTTMTGTIEIADSASRVLVIRGAAGNLRAFRSQAREFEDYLRQVRPRDVVQVAYTETAAVTVRPRP